MRRMLSIVAISGVISGVAASVWGVVPKLGTAFVNKVVNPALMRRGLAGRGASEIGEIEHIGRRSGVRRLTLVHPEVTRSGFRVLVPLGMKSEWALNVVAAGRCRLQLHDVVFDLREPAFVPAGQVDDLPWPVRRLMGALGFQYITLRTVAQVSGALEPVDTGSGVLKGLGAGEMSVATVP